MNKLFEIFPLIIFFIVYKFKDIYWATGVLIVSSIIQLVYLYLKKEPIPKRIWIPAALMVVMGGLTIYSQNEAFLKWKFTIVYCLFAIVLLVTNHIFKNNLIKLLLSQSFEQELPIPEKKWTFLNFAWVLFFSTLAAVNIYVAYNFDTDTWVQFKVFWATGLMIGFMILNIVYLYKYFPKDELEKSKKDNENNLNTNGE